MPQATDATDAPPAVERGKGKGKVSDRGADRAGKTAEDASKSRPVPRRVNPLPENTPGDVPPPVRDRSDDAERGKTGKGKATKGSPEKAKLPKVETPKSESPPPAATPRINPLPPTVPERRDPARPRSQ